MAAELNRSLIFRLLVGVAVEVLGTLRNYSFVFGNRIRNMLNTCDFLVRNGKQSTIDHRCVSTAICLTRSGLDSSDSGTESSIIVPVSREDRHITSPDSTLETLRSHRTIRTILIDCRSRVGVETVSCDN